METVSFPDNIAMNTLLLLNTKRENEPKETEPFLDFKTNEVVVRDEKENAKATPVKNINTATSSIIFNIHN